MVTPSARVLHAPSLTEEGDVDFLERIVACVNSAEGEYQLNVETVATAYEPSDPEP